MKKLFLECVVVLLAGAILSLAANAVSPRGLKITRNYFPKPKPSPPAPVLPATNTLVETQQAREETKGAHAQELKDLGYNVLTTAEAAEFFKDPRVEQGLVIFIDARDTRHYEEGHIPGAYQFYHYRPEQYLETILPVSQTAEQIIIYCTGGDCEDSQFAATFLRDSIGIPSEKILIFVGGFDDWTAAKLPVEMGQRASGVFK